MYFFMFLQLLDKLCKGRWDLTILLPRALRKNVPKAAKRKTVIINHHKIPQVC